MIDLLSILNADRPLPRIHTFLLTEAQGHLAAAAGVMVCVDEVTRSAQVTSSLGLSEYAPPQDGLRLEEGGSQALASAVFGTEPYTSIAMASLGWLQTLAQDSVPDEVRTWFSALARIYRTMLCVPVDANGHRYGSLWLFCVAPPEQLDICPASVEAVRTLASLMIENAQLRLKAEQAAILQERSRLARDLHDSVTQSLYSLTLMIEAARRLAGSNDLLQVQRALDRVEQIGYQALKEMRLLVYQLRPSVLRRVGLVRALAQRLETVEKRAGVDGALVVEGTLHLSSLLDEQLYYVVQEALNNSLKHAAASRVVVTITGDANSLCLEIEDDGSGFDPGLSEAAGGFGLAGMRERVDKLGGEFIVLSEKGRGTKVRILLQLLAGELENRET